MPKLTTLLQYLLLGMLIAMRTATRATRTFSVDKEILAEVKRTRGDLSESERVNRLLRCALDLEKHAALEREIAGFFAVDREDRAERRAFESASRSSWARE
jgi:hypothetical protein